MRYLKIASNVFRTVLKLNVFKTLYFNFKVLPFYKAIRLPFHFYGKVIFENLTGKFTITTPTVHFGMIVFGVKDEIAIALTMPTQIYNSGTIEFNGNALFERGIKIMVWNDATLIFGKTFSLGSLSRIIVFRRMRFGNEVLISWECQFFDSDFHFIKTNENKIKDNCGDVNIEDGVWIGTRATVLKNTVLPKNTIVGANSLCSGNYSEKYGEGILLSGIPAKLAKKDIEYLKDKKQELELFQYFKNHQNSEINWKN